MFVSKFWTLLLALVAGAILAVILLAKDTVNRERFGNATLILYKEMTKTDVALKLHARKRLDILMSVALDPDVRKQIQAASGKDKPSRARDELLAVLRKRNADLDKFTADLLIAVDMEGKVICQIGKSEREYDYDLSGFPAVDAALRGYLRDDVWKIGNDVFLIAARPVIEQGRYVGAIIHAMKINDALASDISPSTQLAFFAGNMIIAVGKAKAGEGENAQGAQIANALDQVLSSEKYKKEGYSDVQKINASKGDFIAVYSKIRGEAAGNDVGFALVTSFATMASPTEFYEKAGTQDVKALPLYWLIAGVLLATLLGWLFNYLEGQRPISSLGKAIEAIKKADPTDQLNIYKFGRRIRKVAKAVNSLVDYKIRAILETSGTSSKNIDAILGKPESMGRMSSASFRFTEADSISVPPPPPEKPLPVAKPIGKVEKPVAEAPVENAPPQPSAPPHQTPPQTQPQTASMPQVPQPAKSEPEDEQTYFQEVYKQFVELKNKLGEPTNQLTFDRFLVTLKKNRDTLVARYGCRKVRFQVYEKEGKASLRATPVKE